MTLSLLSSQKLVMQNDFSRLDEKLNFLDFQPQAKQALNQFLQSQFGALLVLKSEIFPEFINEITEYLKKYSVDLPIISKMDFNKNSLFGYSVFLERELKTEYVKGAIHEADKGILIVNIRSLLLDITQWDKLKQALLFGEYEPNSVNHSPYLSAKEKSTFKLILVGEREDISTLSAYDDGLYQFGQYTEIKSYLSLSDNVEQWGGYVQNYAENLINKRLTSTALNQFLQAYIRESESRELVSISPTLLRKHLLGIQNFYPNVTEIDEVKGYFDYLEQQSSILNQYTVGDILTNQLYIETEGEEIGQINGLSVIEFEGIPHSFGEPLRMSCNVQYGDGEITDIERKVELGGNIHSKGIIIAQSCLANLLELPTQLPFSASIAFEQSYSEIDGDSSSLAIFNVLVSALAKVGLPQSIAVTGAIDQFGNVLSVGGVNQKIEGFFNICHARQLTGKQGVIIPAACVSHLSLSSEVVEAVEQGLFKIWTVENVFDAIAILFERDFYDDEKAPNSAQTALFTLIHQNLDERESEETSGSFLSKICKKIKLD
ncbi:TPA: AAA family ATPase [Mannheimia haemolytica]|uniref:endopeptidase La n=2 Tax=Mannheimia haemolytica TaxID=75985 RepID=A0A378NF44_MANHA|nr:AAA family ATPase [Mannheimia haemolytica]AGQ38729.1 protease [Mannheimia haemolytica D171]EEY09369.1 putative S16 family lon protease [Mannheimia haemolytica serotype A2 str. OVINE]EEY13550.1 putative S16 family lon protease [Mannheimia haemolytica serotype A2 str. BOVINE]KYL18050.1 protease [Mannheimia haemolytica]KYL23651.1 protease [Mannheimia haemolytica]